MTVSRQKKRDEMFTVLSPYRRHRVRPWTSREPRREPKECPQNSLAVSFRQRENSRKRTRTSSYTDDSFAKTVMTSVHKPDRSFAPAVTLTALEIKWGVQLRPSRLTVQGATADSEAREAFNTPAVSRRVLRLVLLLCAKMIAQQSGLRWRKWEYLCGPHQQNCKGPARQHLGNEQHVQHTNQCQHGQNKTE